MREIVTLLEELIKFKTTADNPGEIDRCAGFIEDYLKELGVEYTRIDNKGVPSILVTTEEGTAPVILMSHIDVVDAPDALFLPREKDGNLYGRGSVDDKYAVALSLFLLKTWLDTVIKEGGGQKDLPFGILITGDEEIGGHKGAKHALEKVRPGFCFALDGGSLEKIVIREKGILNLRLRAKGLAAHGARPWLGRNAVDILVDDLVRVRKLFGELDRDDPEHWHRTMNTGIIRGGNAVNQVPDLAEAVLDIRYTENDDPDALTEEIRAVIASDLVVEAKEPVFNGGSSPHMDLLLEVAADAKTGFEHGASDARFLAEFGVPGVVWGADGDMSQHSMDEHVNIESVYRLCSILNEYFTRSRKIDGPVKSLSTKF